MANVIDGECCGCASSNSILPDPDAPKKPIMLPFQALHRIASPFARAHAPSPDLGSFASASESTSPSVTPTVTHRPRRRTNSSVSFFCDAEWFYINEEDPFGPPVLKRLRLKPEDCDQGDGNSQSSCNSDRHFDDSVGAATSTAPLLLNLAVPGACPDEEANATSKPSLVLPLPVERHLDENLDGDMTPKAKNHPSVCLGFGFKRGGDFDDGIDNSGLQAKTPKAPSSIPAFGMFSDPAEHEDLSDDEVNMHVDPESVQECNGEATPSAKNNLSSGFGFCCEDISDDEVNMHVDTESMQKSNGEATPAAKNGTSSSFGFCTEDNSDNEVNMHVDPEPMQKWNGAATPTAKNNASSSLDFCFGGEDDDQESVTSDRMHESSSESDCEKVAVDPMTPKSRALTLQFGKCSLAMGSFDTISTAASDSSPRAATS